MSKHCSISCRICNTIAEFIEASAEPWVLYLVMEFLKYWFRFRKCMLQILNVLFLESKGRKLLAIIGHARWSIPNFNTPPPLPLANPGHLNSLHHHPPPPSPKELSIPVSCLSDWKIWMTPLITLLKPHLSVPFVHKGEILSLKNFLTPKNKEKTCGYIQPHQKINPIQTPHPSQVKISHFRGTVHGQMPGEGFVEGSNWSACY